MKDVEGSDVPSEIAAQLVRALDRSPSTFTVLIGRDLKTRWLSKSASWVSGTDPASRKGRESLERVHPEDVPRLLGAFEQLNEASANTPGIPVVEPLRYRLGSDEDGWITREALVNNLLDDPLVDGLLLIVRPVGGALDGVGHVIDLLVADAALPEVLGACASLVPAYLGAAAVVGIIDYGEVVGVPANSAVESFCSDDRWWRDTLADGKIRAPVDFFEFPDDLADQARQAGFLTAWMLPIQEQSNGEVIGCVAVWVGIDVQLNIGTDHALRQTQRLASLVIGEQRRNQALQRAAVTDPLTGVGNRSALRRRLDAAGDDEVSLAFVDLDDFKAVNDTYGHDAGDTVLREVARRLGVSVREDDLVVRLGGDEFAVVFADGTVADGIDRLVERVHHAIETPIALSPDAEIQVRASVGVATGPPGEVVHLADDALYASKRRKP
ncbi:MAG TPA: GGDEF domain-containing protein [Acidimicrobiales bacterium]|jgi:diguanylate cyclase (GGDEF)-like protein